MTSVLHILYSRMSQGFTRRNSVLLSLMTLAFVAGEVAHFLFGTLSREIAQDIHFGRLKCYQQLSSSSTSYLGPKFIMLRYVSIRKTSLMMTVIVNLRKKTSEYRN